MTRIRHDGYELSVVTIDDTTVVELIIDESKNYDILETTNYST